jgi:uroporphyrinogen decarboxylase
VTEHLLLQACRREPVPRPPVWLMRQAGRYLPEYRALRARAQFLDLVTDPARATEVTLQPVDRFGVDAAILFSDILLVPRAMGMALRFDEGQGPVFPEPLRAPADLLRLRDPVPEDDLGFVLAAIGETRRALGERAPLIGFAGGPWTLACYMVEGERSKDWRRVKRLLAEEPARLRGLLGRLAEVVGRFLQAQARAGAQALQVFESWAGALGPADFRAHALPHLARVIRLAKESGVPVIAFAPGAGWALEEIARATGADLVGLDWQTDPAEARRRLEPLGVGWQGNLDPAWLYAPRGVLEERTRALLTALHGPGYVANLGHGVLPDTPVEGVRAFVETVRRWEG